MTLTDAFCYRPKDGKLESRTETDLRHAETNKVVAYCCLDEPRCLACYQSNGHYLCDISKLVEEEWEKVQQRDSELNNKFSP